MAYSKVFLVAALCLGLSVAAPQNLVRLVPAGFGSGLRTVPAGFGFGSGLRAIPADTIESHAVHTVSQDAPVITRLVQTDDGLAHIDHLDQPRFVQAAPLVTRLVQAGPAVTRVVPAAPAVTTVVQAAPVRTVVEEVQAEVSDPNPQYNFGYSVADTITGDSKTREEQRDGDVVTGSYSVADPDGRIRRVTYTADSVNGFQAKVTYDGEEGPVAIPTEGGSVQSSVVVDNSNDDTVSIVNARQRNQQQVLVQQQQQQQLVAAPTLVRAVPQSIGTATLVRNVDGSHALHRVAAAQQPQLIQIDNGDQTATLVRNFDGSHALHQPQLVRIDGSDQTFEITPFGLRNLGGGFTNQPLVNAHFIQA